MIGRKKENRVTKARKSGVEKEAVHNTLCFSSSDIF
jgi:hypothetical protein